MDMFRVSARGKLKEFGKQHLAEASAIQEELNPNKKFVDGQG